MEPKLLLASVAFQQGVSGYSGTVDTMTSANNPTADYSTRGSLDVNGSPLSQGLLRFEDMIGDGVGQIPLGSTILSATLELEVSNAGNPIALHPMLQSWSDADTWNSLVNGLQADNVEASVSADVTTGSVSTGLLQIDVTDRLQSWADNPTGNLGWAILPTGSNRVDFDSADGAVPPRLVVNYGIESLPLITIVATDNSGSEVGPDSGVFTVSRSRVTTGDLIVDYALSGTATAGTDYNSLSGSVTIPDGSVSASIVVTPIDDSDAEGNETASATLSTSSAYYIGPSYFDTVTIADNDALLTVSIQAPAISEAAGGTTATVSRNSGTTNPLVVVLQSDDLTEASVPDTVTIPAGQTTSPSFNITSVDDRIVDGNQTVMITASATGHSSGTDTLDVTDDDVDGLRESCLDDPGPQITLSGPQPFLYAEDVEPNTTFDATDATWYATSTTRVEIEGASNFCWHGGLVEHNWPADQDWDTTHGDHGFKFANTPNLVLEDVQIKNAGDGISLYEGTEDFLVRGVYMEDIRDDAIEHDWLGSGTIEDTFINGAYVAFAARSRDAVDVDGSENTWVIKDSLTFLRPQIGVYKGPSPGYGRFFKWEDLGPKLEIHNSIFRADELPDYEFLGIPEGKLVSSSNNIVVWQGIGEAPTLPEGFTLTQDMSVWDNAVLQWKIDHGFAVDESENHPPVLAAIGAQSVDEGSLLTFTALATDADVPANTLTFSLDSGAPIGATIDSTTGQFRWTPGEVDGPGVYTVTVRVVDDGTPSLDDFETFDITVDEFNQAPVLAAIGNKSVDEGSLLTFTASATDADLPANSLTFSLDSGAPAGAIINPTTGEFRWTPGEADGPAIHSVTVRVVDDGTSSLIDFETINISVGAVNQAPVLATIGNKNVDEGSLLTFTASATDANLPANTLTFSLDSGAPLGATIDPSTGQFRWTPGEADGPGTYLVTVRVTDDETPRLDDSETFNIIVGEVNQPPVLAAIGTKNVDEGTLLTFTASATDANLPANNLTFSLDSGAPAGATIDPSTGQFRWTPSEGTSPGNHTVTVRVTDDGVPSLDDFETVTITVNDVNVRPVLAAINAQSVEEGSPVTFTASATDADLPANNLTFSLDAGAPLSANIDPSTGEFSWTPGESHGSGLFSVTVRVTDDGTPNLEDFETFSIAVREVNQAPVLAAIGDKRINEGRLITFTASAADADSPANNLIFSLDSGAPDGATIDPNTGQFRWTPDEADGPGVFTVTVRVTDDAVPSLDDFETVTITVNDVNLPPVLAAIGAKSVDEGSLLAFTASATDADLPANTFTFSLDHGAPAGASISPTTGQFRWTPGEADGPGVHTVTVRVTDDGTPTLDDFRSFDITVGEVNQPPVLSAIGNKSVDEGSLLAFAVSANDADLPTNILTFSLDYGAPTGATINPHTGQFLWTPGEADGPGVYPVTVRVVDEGTPGLADVKTFDITVGDVNQAPVLEAIGNKSVDEGSLLAFAVSANDADLPANNVSFSLDAGAPVGASIDPITGQFRWTPGEADGPGVYSVTVRVVDDGTPSLDDFETFDIAVGEVNLPPVLAAIGPKHVDEASPLTFTASATDADSPANNLTFSLDYEAPEGATIDPITGQFSWTPPGGVSPGTHTVTIRVADDGVPSLDDFQIVTITVNDVSLPPVLATIGDKIVDEGSPLTFTASATDADLPANNLTFSLDAGAPLSASIDPNTGEFSWTPGESHGSAVFSVTVRVTDDEIPNLEDFETVTISVREVNQAPVLRAIGDKGVTEGRLLTFTASATDADSPVNNLTFSLDSDAPAGATINPSTGQFRWTPTPETSPGTHSVVVRVTDDGVPSSSDFQPVLITVIPLTSPRDPLDVNRSGAVTVLDALAIINQINRMLANDSESVTGSDELTLSDYDTSGDGKISALDALLVINYLGEKYQEAESAVDSVLPSLVLPNLNAVTPDLESTLDDDLIRVLADDIIAGLDK